MAFHESASTDRHPFERRLARLDCACHSMRRAAGDGPMASVSSLRVVMLIRPCLVASRSRRTIRRVANYMRQRGISGDKTDASMRARGGLAARVREEVRAALQIHKEFSW